MLCANICVLNASYLESGYQRSIPISHCHSHSIKNILYTHTNLLFSPFTLPIAFHFGVLSNFGSPKHWRLKSFIIHKQHKRASISVAKMIKETLWWRKKHQCHFKDRTKQLVKCLSSWKFSSSDIRLFTRTHCVGIAHKKNDVSSSATNSAAFHLQQNVTIDCMAVHEARGKTKHHNKNSIVNY